MKWHDCKIDPPNKDGYYVLWVKNIDNEEFWTISGYIKKDNLWYSKPTNKIWIFPYKWAEVNLEASN